MNIEVLDLSVRTWSLLKRNNINTIEQLENMDDDGLMNMRSMGKKTLEEIKEKLNEFHVMMNKCEFCRNLDKVYEMVCYVPTDNGSSINIPINFCPKCGSKIN